MATHTHVLARPHNAVRKDGEGKPHRVTDPAGTRCSPTDAQLENMPDVFIPLAQAEAAEAVRSAGDVKAKKRHGIKGKSVGAITDLVGTVNDLETLEEMLAEEEGGRRRVGALAAINARGEALSAARTDGSEETEG